MPIIKLLGKTMKALHIIQTKFKNDPIVVRLGYSQTNAVGKYLEKCFYSFCVSI